MKKTPWKVLSSLLFVFTVGCSSEPTITHIQPIQPPRPSATLAPTQTITTLPTKSPTETYTPIPSAPCFSSKYDPFAFVKDNDHWLAVGRDGVEMFNLNTGQQEQFIPSPASLNGPFVAVSPDGKMLAWAFEDGTIEGISLADQSVVFSIDSGQGAMIKLEFSPNGEHLYSASHDGSIKVWDNEGKLEDTFQSGVELLNIGISFDEQLLATVPFDGPVTLFSLDDFTPIKNLGGYGGYDTSDAVFSPDRKFLAADLASGLFLWRISDGAELLGSSNPINSMAVAYSPDGKYLAYADFGNVVLSTPMVHKYSTFWKGCSYRSISCSFLQTAPVWSQSTIWRQTCGRWRMG